MLHISSAVLSALCGRCTYTGNGWVSMCGKQQSFHSPSVRLCVCPSTSECLHGI